MYPLEVVTPEGIVFKGEVEQTVINTADGEIGILENHMLLLTNVVPGKLRIEIPEEEPKEYAVTHGVIDVRGDKVIVLVEEAFGISEIDVEREKRLLEEAKAKLEERETLSLEEIENYERMKERAEILLELAGVKVR
ncbi:MAG TPA: ATP synthase F1 subunit epsilon [Persephonella sp.]|uniref:ATP synthase epsilon chain n=1 Tax=Persephonella marina (strain DSM 14350 / EX-H1) TaxID=123214 RepID=ATPE_PERMH|nr:MULTISPECIES: ATP synthase F1 subunit epsilon [Persephonella]C0QQ90.1 RecName: Full=ATP synthase epsilon chain; AltName: Full=ATP synthase F1 sector epsilon subunit; AltName: Full=F-ATPase epsilon subunit [Persephonella marina EX-H1]ACO03315.1 ATP synthase F1, epsilon subunit [Persephonella marina EX-H1]HCB69557.1 ATP synthase F1 subunit epsilon [Persephonella sp.]